MFKVVIVAKRFWGQHNVGGVHTPVVHKEISDTAKAFEGDRPDAYPTYGYDVSYTDVNVSGCNTGSQRIRQDGRITRVQKTLHPGNKSE